MNKKILLGIGALALTFSAAFAHAKSHFPSTYYWKNGSVCVPTTVNFDCTPNLPQNCSAVITGHGVQQLFSSPDGGVTCTITLQRQ